MDRDEVSPDNNGTGKLYQCLIVFRFFLILHQQYPEPIHPRMAHFHYPPPWFIQRISLLLGFFFPSSTDARLISHPLKSPGNIERALREKGFTISDDTVGNVLKEMGYSLQQNRKMPRGLACRVLTGMPGLNI
jgi:hypothetical protein